MQLVLTTPLLLQWILTYAMTFWSSITLDSLKATLLVAPGHFHTSLIDDETVHLSIK
jgi:hypothetical protein